MKYYIVTIRNAFDNVEQHIVQLLHDGGYRAFPANDDNPNMVQYLAWVAEGNTAEQWNPENEEQ